MNFESKIQNRMGRAGFAPAMRLSDAAILQTVAYAHRRADPRNLVVPTGLEPAITRLKEVRLKPICLQH